MQKVLGLCLCLVLSTSCSTIKDQKTSLIDEGCAYFNAKDWISASQKFKELAILDSEYMIYVFLVADLAADPNYIKYYEFEGEFRDRLVADSNYRMGYIFENEFHEIVDFCPIP